MSVGEAQGEVVAPLARRDKNFRAQNPNIAYFPEIVEISTKKRETGGGECIFGVLTALWDFNVF